mmetsp:Transcript_36720/g.101396  ORF Transcript_36720/g.101396 Transcript_36720/m.101396 type:complete len:239 (+) Transcript_36720:168-884(+)
MPDPLLPWAPRGSRRAATDDVRPSVLLFNPQRTSNLGPARVSHSSSLVDFSRSWQMPHACGQSGSMLPGFFVHSPFSAQSAHASSLSEQTVVQEPHVLAQSRNMAAGLARHSSLPHTSHCVEFLSSHRLCSQTSQLLGHVLSVKPGFLWHCPSAAQPGQSLCVSTHSPLQTPHDTGHSFSMKLGFSPQAPDAVQPAQSSCASLHVGLQSPQLVGHVLIMNSLLVLHCPLLAQLPHETS